MDKFIKYPLYPPSGRRLESLLVKLRFAGIARCPVCGRLTVILVRGENLRETCICVRCKATNRQRQIAYVLCSAVGRVKSKRMTSLRDLAKLDDFLVYNTEARGPIHDLLSKMKGYVCSEYFGDSYRSGDCVNDVLHQDLMDLSFGDESVDLMLSSDVFEHIPDPYKAHQEVYRVLKPGGRHVFTVPFYQTEFLDEKRAILDMSGNAVFLLPPLYHEDPIRPGGALVYRIFSLEMLVKLRGIGFRTMLYHLYKPLSGIWGPNAIVFEAIKD